MQQCCIYLYICCPNQTFKKMKKQLSILLLSFLTFGVSVVSCKKEDAEKPVVKITSPTPYKEYHPGESIQVSATLTDNEELNQYKLEIHYDDGHGHKSTMHGGSEWEFEEIVSISGKSHTINQSVKIPDNPKHGKYHVIIECTDKAGNEAAPAVVDIKIDHD